MNEEIALSILAEVKGLKSELNGVKQEMHGFRTELNGVKLEIEGVKREQQLTNERLVTIEAKQQLIYEQTAHLTDFRSETLTRMEQLATREDLRFFDLKIVEHERAIFTMQHRS